MAPFPPCEAVIPMSAQEYLVERDNAAFRGLLAEVMQLGEVEVLETWREGDIRYEKEVQRPDYDRWIPKVGRKLIKDPNDLNFYDVIEYDPKSLESPPYRLPITSTFPLLGDKLQVRRTIVIEPIDENHCRHRVEGEVHTQKLFGIGTLAEHIVIDSTVKTVQHLPEITARYLEVRREMMRSPEGRKALLQGVPNVVIEVAEVNRILQKPYEEPQAAEMQQQDIQQQPQQQVQQQAEPGKVFMKPPEAGAAVVQQVTEEVRAPPTEEVEEVRVAPGQGRDWKAVIEAQPTAAGDTAANRATVAVLEEDREAALRHLHRLSPSKVQKAILKEVKHEPSFTRHERKAIKHLVEAEKHRQRHNEDTNKWRQFWRRSKPATAPVGNVTARIVQLVSVWGAVGLVELDEKGEVKAIVAEAKPPDTGHVTEDNTSKMAGHKDRLHGLKRLFDKMGIGRHEE